VLFVWSVFLLNGTAVGKPVPESRIVLDKGVVVTLGKSGIAVLMGAELIVPTAGAPVPVPKMPVGANWVVFP
jgi:hypothetical protein